MIIVGAKGFAKEVLEVVSEKCKSSEIAFYDDVNQDIGGLLYSQFSILKNQRQVEDFFNIHGNKFTLGIGNPRLRKLLYEKFTLMGGEIETTISKMASVGSYGNRIEQGCNIMQNVVITNDAQVGLGSLINIYSCIAHDVTVGDFCEICPNVNLLGNCKIANYTFVGTGSIVLPNVKVGNNVLVAAGSLVTRDLPDNCMAMGVPAKITKMLEPLAF
jgi:sugar O-acyltransferase (sialic acid O-acetyltransferase NeuD family)